MSKHFRVRTALPITVGKTTHIFYIRELGYLELDELRTLTLVNVRDEGKETSGISLLEAVVLACVEEEDGIASYTKEEWRTEIQQVFFAVGNAAMKAQGIDLDKARKTPSEPLSEEEAAGNELPSRTSGENSPLSSAAPLAN